MVVGAGATSALVHKSWFRDLCEWLESADVETPRIESSEMALRFGGGAVARALGKSLIPVCFQGEWARSDTHVIGAFCLALFSINSLWGVGAIVGLRDKRLVMRKIIASVNLLSGAAGHLPFPPANAAKDQLMASGKHSE